MLQPAISAGAFLAQLLSGFSGEPAAESAAWGASSGDFSEILSGQEAATQLLGQLKELLPEQVHPELEALFAGGKTLPSAADVADLMRSELALTEQEMAPLRAALAAVLPSLTPAQPAPAVLKPADTADAPAAPQRASEAQTGLASDARPVLLPAHQQASLVPLADTPEARPVLPVVAAIAPTAGRVQQLPGQGSRSGEQAIPQISMLSGSIGPGAMDSSQPVRPVTLPAELNLPLGDAKWGQALGDRILLMVGRVQQSAAIKITPPEMGVIDIKVSLQNDQVNVGFTAQHAAVREALEAAVPRLREMFGENNLQLVNVDVGQRGDGGRQAPGGALAGQSERGQQGSDFSAAGSADAAADNAAVDYYRGDGLLDDYA